MVDGLFSPCPQAHRSRSSFLVGPRQQTPRHGTDRETTQLLPASWKIKGLLVLGDHCLMEEERHMSTVETWTEKHGRIARHRHERVGNFQREQTVSRHHHDPGHVSRSKHQVHSQPTKIKSWQTTAQKSHLSSIIIRTKHLYQGTCPLLATLSCPFPVPPNASREPDSPISMK